MRRKIRGNENGRGKKSVLECLVGILGSTEDEVQAEVDRILNAPNPIAERIEGIFPNDLDVDLGTLLSLVNAFRALIASGVPSGAALDIVDHVASSTLREMDHYDPTSDETRTGSEWIRDSLEKVHRHGVPREVVCEIVGDIMRAVAEDRAVDAATGSRMEVAR
jgi:hypothetical protein